MSSQPVKTDPAALSIIFAFAGNWNTELASVSKAWKGAFEKHLFTQWHALESIAGPDLLHKMRSARELNPSTAPVRRLFQDLSHLLKQVAQPSVPRVQVIGFVQRTINIVLSGFNIQVPGVVPIFLEKQQKITHHNRTILGNRTMLGSQYPKLNGPSWTDQDLIDVSKNEVRDLKQFINRWSYDKGLFIRNAELTELPAFLAKMPLKALDISHKPKFRTLPLEIMENLFLRRLCIDLALYPKLPKKLRDYLERQVSLGRCKFESYREANAECLKYTLSMQISSLRYDRFGVVTPYQNRAGGVISISVTEHMGPTLFYDEMCYVAVSPLGKLYQAAYQGKSVQEIEAHFELLSEKDKRRLPFEKNPDILCSLVNQLIVEQVKGSSAKLFTTVCELGKKQIPKDPFWSEDDEDWGRTHCLVNKGRLADALMLCTQASEII